MTIFQILEADASNRAPEIRSVVLDSASRVQAAKRMFDKNFDPEGVPKTFKGMLLAYKYSGSICYSCYYRKGIRKVLNWLEQYAHVFSKGNRK